MTTRSFGQIQVTVHKDGALEIVGGEHGRALAEPVARQLAEYLATVYETPPGTPAEPESVVSPAEPENASDSHDSSADAPAGPEPKKRPGRPRKTSSDKGA